MNSKTRLISGGAAIALVMLWSLCSWATPAAAAPLTGDAQPEASSPGQSSAPTLVLGGLLGGTVAFTVGASIGSALGRDDTKEFSGLEEAYYIGSTFGALGLGAGMEAANHGYGDGGLVLLTSLGVGVAGYVALVQTKEWFMLPLTVVAQLTATAVVERATATRNLRDLNAGQAGAAGSWTLAGGPSPDGFGLVVLGRF